MHEKSLHPTYLPLHSGGSVVILPSDFMADLVHKEEQLPDLNSAVILSLKRRQESSSLQHHPPACRLSCMRGLEMHMASRSLGSRRAWTGLSLMQLPSSPVQTIRCWTTAHGPAPGLHIHLPSPFMCNVSCLLVFAMDVVCCLLLAMDVVCCLLFAMGVEMSFIYTADAQIPSI